MQQLPLSLTIRDDATFDNFYSGSNAVLVTFLSQMFEGHEPYAYLWGNRGSGRSHLLQACCHLATQTSHTSVYIDLSLHEMYSPLMLEGLEQMELVCLDNIDAIAGLLPWEEAAFHLFNRIRESGGRLVVSALSSPSSLNLQLRDLQSRLSWGVTFVLAELSDEEKCQVLILRAKARGLTLTEDVARFLLTRATRSLDKLFALVSELDVASLSAQRKLTIPFVKSVLNL